MVVLIVFFLKLFLVSGKKCLRDKDMSWLAADVFPCELFDGEDYTCVNTLNQSIELSFTQDVLVKSFTLEFDVLETVKEDSFLVSVLTDPANGSTTAQALAVKKANSQSVVVNLISPVQLRKFTVEIKTDLLLCSLYIDGGHRLKQHASIYMGENIEQGVISKLRDGNRRSSCVDFSSVGTFSVLTFSWKYIFKVEIYLKEHENEEIVLQVSGTDVEDKKFEFTVESKGNNPVLLFVNREVRQTDIHWNNKKLNVCEVEIFGETVFENLAISAAVNDIYSTTLQTRSSVFYGIIVAVCVALVLYQISQRCEKKPVRKGSRAKHKPHTTV
ncbi:uncharacterized protein LOC131943287 isoform X2 [Physella acuta]|uniref:uncharacterized protein LOC131943287 isoform X2 n=1 Tax=Physella acuta TaxID=109671 RepID=UPI0027DB390E|nr:uncharacterized protein LOC131943287 isoform X2 [Physella acuta]